MTVKVSTGGQLKDNSPRRLSQYHLWLFICVITLRINVHLLSSTLLCSICLIAVNLHLITITFYSSVLRVAKFAVATYCRSAVSCMAVLQRLVVGAPAKFGSKISSEHQELIAKYALLHGNTHMLPMAACCCHFHARVHAEFSIVAAI